MATDKLVDFDHVTDYISREAAIDAVDVGNLHHGIIDALQAIISDIPSADVRPVVKAHWNLVGKQMVINLANAREQYSELGYPHRNILLMQCDRCRLITMVDESIRYDYCPHCGADMREATP